MPNRYPAQAPTPPSIRRRASAKARRARSLQTQLSKMSTCSRPVCFEANPKLPREFTPRGNFHSWDGPQSGRCLSASYAGPAVSGAPSPRRRREQHAAIAVEGVAREPRERTRGEDHPARLSSPTVALWFPGAHATSHGRAIPVSSAEHRHPRQRTTHLSFQPQPEGRGGRHTTCDQTADMPESKHHQQTATAPPARGPDRPMRRAASTPAGLPPRFAPRGCWLADRAREAKRARSGAEAQVSRARTPPRRWQTTIGIPERCRLRLPTEAQSTRPTRMGRADGAGGASTVSDPFGPVEPRGPTSNLFAFAR